MKWTAEQKKALRESIAHWERMREYRKPLRRGHEMPIGLHCACCKLAGELDLDPEQECAGCPIYEYIGADQCKETPYRDARASFMNWKHGDALRHNWVRAATKEINFLEQVLEAGE